MSGRRGGVHCLGSFLRAGTVARPLRAVATPGRVGIKLREDPQCRVTSVLEGRATAQLQTVRNALLEL